MDRAMSHAYRTLDVPVRGGGLRVGVWDPIGEHADDVLLVHGVTSSHLVWPLVVDALPGVRAIAPDLRGRGRSNRITGSAGLAAHADDLAATLDALGISRVAVAGHSMGAFVAVVFAHRHPERVSRLILIDGGLPLDVPDGVEPDDLVAAILGPTAGRLSMRFADAGEYREFWRQHPAFQDEWPPELEQYFDYDLDDDGAGALRPATSYQTTVDDTIDLTSGTALPTALAALRHPARFVTVPRGLQNETPGLYAPAHAERVLAANPEVRHTALDDLNHYTVVLSTAGADAVAAIIRGELDPHSAVESAG